MTTSVYNTSKLTVEVVQNEKKFLELRGKWNALLSQSPVNNVFLTWDWLFVWWRHFNQNKTLFILLIKEDDGNIAGIAPFFVSNYRIRELVALPIKAVKFLGTEGVSCNYLDFIIKPGKEKEVLGAVFSYLKENRRLWDILLLSDIRDDSVSLGYLSRYAREYGYAFKRQSSAPYAYLPSFQSWDAYLGSLGAKTRRNIRKSLKLVETELHFTYETVKNRQELHNVMNRLFELREKRWQHSRYRREKFKSFHSDISLKFYDNGWLKLNYLCLGGYTPAIMYGFKYKDQSYIYATNYDPDASSRNARYSVGTALFSYCIRDFISENLAYFHFMKAGGEYKQKFRVRILQTVEMAIGKSYISYMVYNLSEFGEKSAASVLRRCAPRQLSQWLKRIMRQ